MTSMLSQTVETTGPLPTSPASEENSETIVGPQPAPVPVVTSTLADIQPGMDWEQCLQIGLKENEEIQLAQVQLEQAEGSILKIRSALLPRLSVNGVSAPPTVGIGFQQLLFSRATIPGIRAGSNIRTAAQVNVMMTVSDIVLDLRLDFAEALFKQETATLLKKELGILIERANKSQLLFDSGKIDRQEMLAIEVRKNLISQSLDQALFEEKKSKLDLARTMGISASHPALKQGLSGHLESRFKLDPKRKKQTLKDLVKLSLRERLDLQLLRQLVITEGLLVEITGANSYPALSAFAGMKVEFAQPKVVESLIGILTGQTEEDENNNQSPVTDAAVNTANELGVGTGAGAGIGTGAGTSTAITGSDPLNPFDDQNPDDEDNEDIKDSNVDFGLALTYRIIDGGETLGKTRQARATKAKREIVLQELQRNIPGQVALAFYNHESAKRLYADLVEQSAFAESDATARKFFDAGQISVTELLQSREELITFEKNKLALQHNLDITSAFLERALGMVRLDPAEFIPEKVELQE